VAQAESPCAGAHKLRYHFVVKESRCNGGIMSLSWTKNHHFCTKKRVCRIVMTDLND
jgi:hypothetical protein